jgi:hypothetical protein
MPKYCSEPAIEYTRADLTDARIRRAVELALGEAAAACDPTSYRAHHASVRRRCQNAIRALATDENIAAIIERAAQEENGHG